MEDLTWRHVDYEPETGEMDIPGPLPPETSIPITLSIRDVAAFVVYKKVQIVLKTQTGKEIKKTFGRANNLLHRISETAHGFRKR
ncbi:MAG: hypothetical protein H8E47_07800 [Anaerolineales bacterium]|nr:hypothetical protein [Anaerolineales bacterium]